MNTNHSLDKISIKALDATNEELIKSVRNLLSQYAAERDYDAALGDFTNELENLPGEYTPPSGQLLIAFEGSQVVGCIAYRTIDTNVCEMKRLFVLATHRNNGIGKLLVSELLKNAVLMNFTEIKLDNHPHMKSAESLYKKLGFNICSPYNNNPTPGIKHFKLSI